MTEQEPRRRRRRRRSPDVERVSPVLYIPRIVPWLSELLDRVKEITPYEATRELRNRQREMILDRVEANPFEAPPTPIQALELVDQVNYHGITKWFYVLRQLGMIYFTRSEPARGALTKNYYAKMEGSDRLWDMAGVEQALYPRVRWGGGRYRSAARRGELELGRDATPLGDWAAPEIQALLSAQRARALAAPRPPVATGLRRAPRPRTTRTP